MITGKLVEGTSRLATVCSEQIVNSIYNLFGPANTGSFPFFLQYLRLAVLALTLYSESRMRRLPPIAHLRGKEAATSRKYRKMSRLSQCQEVQFHAEKILHIP